MFVVPDTIIRILHDVPLNNDYDNTLYFETPQAQSSYFFAPGRAKFTLNNNSYQRKSRGWIKVKIPQNSLWDCSYLMYQNRAYGDKWFYAFILSTEYINDYNTLINFEIDVMQTWMFDYELQPCFVEREHSATDELFENLVEENVQLGDDYVIEETSSFDLTPSSLLILSVDNYTEHLDEDAFIQNKYYYPIKRYSFDLLSETDRNRLTSFMNAIIEDGLEQDIVQISQYPSFMSSYASANPLTTVSKNFTPRLSSMDGYVPKNKKLFTYPYNFLHITNHEGASADFKWELWDYSNGHIGEFTVVGCTVGKPNVIMYPNNYRKITSDIDSGIYASSFPENPWTGDTWKLYWAQHGATYNTDLALGIINGTLQTVGAFTGGFSWSGGSSTSNSESVHDTASTYSSIHGANATEGATQSMSTTQSGITGNRTSSGYNVSFGPLQAVQGLVNIGGTIAKDIAFKHDLKHQPNQSYGQKNADTLMHFVGAKHFGFQHYTIKAQFAEIIDQYFSRFGYACKKIKVPNRNARVNWTYTKTIGCEITATIPNDDATKIKKIYDHGITFWNNPANFGNFGDFTNPVYST